MGHIIKIRGNDDSTWLCAGESTPLSRCLAWLAGMAVAAGMEKKKQVLEHTIPLTGLSLAAGCNSTATLSTTIQYGMNERRGESHGSRRDMIHSSSARGDSFFSSSRGGGRRLHHYTTCKCSHRSSTSILSDEAKC